MLTQQVGIMFNLLIQSTNQSYQALATQMERISDFFVPPQPVCRTRDSKTTTCASTLTC